LWLPDGGQRTAIVVTTLAYGVSHGAVAKTRTLYPGGRAAGFIAPIILTVYGLFALTTLMFHIGVSRYLLLSSCACALVWMYGLYLLTHRNLRLKLAVIPGGKYTAEVLAQTVANVRPLKTLSLNGVRYDGVVADFDHIDHEPKRKPRRSRQGSSEAVILWSRRLPKLVAEKPRPQGRGSSWGALIPPARIDGNHP